MDNMTKFLIAISAIMCLFAAIGQNIAFTVFFGVATIVGMLMAIYDKIGKVRK